MSKKLALFVFLALGAVAASPALAQKEEGKKEGEACGGVAHLKCRPGLECVKAENKPDATGICKKPASHPE
jgi:hypothetical protein